MTSAPTLYTMVLTLSLVKTVAFWRRVISSIRGCCQLPGLSVTGVLLPEICLRGVRCLLSANAVDVPDMLRVLSGCSQLSAKLSRVCVAYYLGLSESRWKYDPVGLVRDSRGEFSRGKRAQAECRVLGFDVGWLPRVSKLKREMEGCGARINKIPDPSNREFYALPRIGFGSASIPAPSHRRHLHLSLAE